MDRDIIHGTVTDSSDVEKFKDSGAYRTILKYICMLDAKIQEEKIRGDTEGNYDLTGRWFRHPQKAGAALGAKEDGDRSAVPSIHAFLGRIAGIIDEVPLEEEDQRYGNKAFVTFVDRIKKEGRSLMRKNLPTKETAIDESDYEVLQKYLQASFGNQTRIDYGTGHSLNFFCFLIVLHILRIVDDSSMFTALEHYFAISRTVILKYQLEPAGSHGVWGIDDYQLLPFLLGSSQFCRRTDMDYLSLLRSEHRGLCYAKALRFVHLHKTYTSLKYSFEERIAHYDTLELSAEAFKTHSPTIYALTDVPFGKINRGMVKMYDNVVLSKYVVIQHFISSKYFPIP